MDSIEQHSSQEEVSDDVTKTEGDTPVSSEGAADDAKEDQDSSSVSRAEVEAQAFHLRAVVFRRDLVSLDDRLEYEERSRDRAEVDIKEKVYSSLALLQTLVPLSAQKPQMLELVQKLQKALNSLPQAISRMSIRSESLGGIKEEQRMVQEMEAMLLHVENLRGIYSAKHAQLTELKESLEEEDKLSSETDDFNDQQVAGSPYYMLWSQGDAEADLSGLNRRNTWRGAGRNATRPALHRLMNSSAWMEFSDPSLMHRYGMHLPLSEEEDEEENQKLPRLAKLRTKLTAFVKLVKTREHPVSRMVWTFPAMVRDRSTWEWWTPLVLAVLMASLLGLLGTLTLQPAFEAGPAGGRAGGPRPTGH